MRTCLLIMNPRNIPECMDAFDELTGVDKTYFSYFTETQLRSVLNLFISGNEYDRYALVSDDGILTQSALDNILTLHDEAGSVATGWVNLDSVSIDTTINPHPLTDTTPTLEAYSLMNVWDALQLPHQPIRTYFHGFACTVMSRELWMKYPFDVYDAGAGGCASDFHQCVRLQADNVPIWTHPNTFFYHVKEVANQRDTAIEKRILVGERTPTITHHRESEA